MPRISVKKRESPISRQRFPFEVAHHNRPAQNMAMFHWHDFMELSFVEQGKGFYEIEDKKYTVHEWHVSVAVCAALLLVFSASSAGAEDTVLGFVPRTYAAQSAAERNLPYRLFIPKNYSTSKKYPLIIWLHGAGERGSDNRSQVVLDGDDRNCVLKLFASDSVQRRHPAFIIAPQCAADRQWVNWPWGAGSYSTTGVAESAEIKSCVGLVKKVAQEYPVDSGAVHVIGISMGGFGAWDIVLRHPAVFAAALEFCGGGDPSKASVVKDLPIRFWHGDADQLVPVSASREMWAALKKAGVDTSISRYTEIPKGDHFAWKAACAAGTETTEWLFSQRRSPAASAGRIAMPRLARTSVAPARTGRIDMQGSGRVGVVVIDASGRVFRIRSRLSASDLWSSEF